MTNTVTEPKPREIAGTLRTIRSRWDRAERIERRHLAQTKQQQLVALADSRSKSARSRGLSNEPRSGVSCLPRWRSSS